MSMFKALLVVMCLVLLIYTGLAVSNEGFNLFAMTLPSIAEFGWPGQFHVDFLTYLILSGLWVAWRHEFSAIGIVLGVLASQLGIVLLSIYLLYAINKANGDMAEVLLGEGRTKARS